MKIPGAIILLGYVIVCGVAVRVLTGFRRENALGVYLLLAAFLVGWFFVITYLVERERIGVESVVVRTAKSGIEVLKVWLSYILGLCIVGAAAAFLLR